jgi:uncharacterized protein
MLMVWDEPKRERNRQAPPVGHGLDFADARDRFEWDTAMIVPAKPGWNGEKRWMAIGFLDGKLTSLVFAYLGTEAISAISLRRASNGERRDYAKQSHA